MRYIIILISVFLFSCDWYGSDNIAGKWTDPKNPHWIMILSKNGHYDVTDKDGNSVFSNLNLKVTWDVITEVEPHQIYLTFTTEDKSERVPFGIYKIENNKLIMRETIIYNRSLMGFDMGVSRYEMPKDFSGIVQVYERIK